MANYRQIHTKIWKDPWFLELSPFRKLLFIYLFSNEQANMMGLYQISQKVIAFETELDMQEVQEGLAQFAADGKVYYADNHVWIVNMFQYNTNNPGSPKTQTHILNTLREIPDIPLKSRLVEHYADIIPDGYGIDTQGIPLQQHQYQEQHQQQEHNRTASSSEASMPDDNDAAAALESIEMDQISAVVQEAITAGLTPQQIIDTCAWAREKGKSAAIVRTMLRKGEAHKPRAPDKGGKWWIGTQYEGIIES